jgi:DNA replication protein DnaC
MSVLEFLTMVEIACPKHGRKTVAKITAPDGSTMTGRCQQCQAEEPREAKAVFDPKAANEERSRRLLEGANIPPIYADCTLQSFRIVNDNMLHVVTRCRELVDGTLLFLILTGTTGVGKSHLAVACMREAINQGQTALFVKEADMLGEIKEAVGERGKSDRRVIRKFSSYDLLVVDEMSKHDHSTYDTDALFDIIDNRFSNKCRTIFTGNLDSDQLKAHFTHPMQSRIKQCGRIGQIVEADWRDHA